MKFSPFALTLIATSALLTLAGPTRAATAPAKPAKKVIIFVWDGLRPDAVTAADTPNLYALKTHQGTFFNDNHSTYPTFTMMNAASFATGGFPGSTGFYGNTLYQSNPNCNPVTDGSGLPKKTCGTASYGTSIAAGTNNFVQPVFTEDYAILDDLQAYYDSTGTALLNVGTLFKAAQAAGLKTAAVGKTGPAALQDFLKGGDLLDESIAYPQSLATELQAAGFALPKKTPLSPRYFTYATAASGTSTITLAPDNGDPTAAAPTQQLADGVTKDPRSTAGSPHNASNAYMMGAYLNYILPQHNPDLTLIWFRTPDSTEHAYGPGSPNFHDGMKAMDALLGQLQAKLAALGLADSTDLIVANDHGHSLVAGDPAYFPLRPINGAIGAGTIDTGKVNPVRGVPVSGDVRTADLLTRQGFVDVFDGNGCAYDPVHSGIKADGSPVYPTQTEDSTGSHGCAPGAKFSTRSYLVPATLPADATVIAANGGSDYLYLPDGDAGRLARIVKLLQSRKEYGAIFVKSRFCSDDRCTNLPGTLPMSLVRLESTSTSTPDVVVSFAYDASAMTRINQGLPGTEYESMQNNWGMHGSFSPRDVHNTLIATGPDFKAGFKDPLPTGNVDVAPTVAHLLGLSLPQADGRVLHEALLRDRTAKPTVSRQTIYSTTAQGLTIQNPTNPDGTDKDSGLSHYRSKLVVTTLTDAAGKSYQYFDHATAIRK
jgi:arylsulfatase A-like enzyme